MPLRRPSVIKCINNISEDAHSRFYFFLCHRKREEKSGWKKVGGMWFIRKYWDAVAFTILISFVHNNKNSRDNNQVKTEYI
jgi:hypothetical protein